ncbi:hypothetical protein FF38_09055 [Lucilia cuprina]|uniref:Uncharacterized protein n=1 Tax=Lucilia cuprina TaxID=7375 RepID=A0A0L0BSF5_LUCCU|nr:hypothetical protein FF38_09055 [Lucilia cuprina]
MSSHKALITFGKQMDSDCGDGGDTHVSLDKGLTLTGIHARSIKSGADQKFGKMDLSSAEEDKITMMPATGWEDDTTVVPAHGRRLEFSSPTNDDAKGDQSSLSLEGRPHGAKDGNLVRPKNGTQKYLAFLAKCSREIRCRSRLRRITSSIVTSRTLSHKLCSKESVVLLVSSWGGPRQAGEDFGTQKGVGPSTSAVAIFLFTTVVGNKASSKVVSK